jgi:hypothetical protein
VADRRHGRDGRTLDPDAAAGALRPYVDAGFTSFDMADHYGSAEIVASRLGGPPTIQRLTKWVPKPGPLTLADARAAVERSLERLGARRIDLLQFHAWSYADPSWIDGLLHLQALKSEGLIAHIGLTNVDAAHLNMVLATGIEVVSDQVCFSLLDRRAAGALSDGLPPPRRAPARLRHAGRRLAVGPLARTSRAGLGARRNVVADEVRPFHARRRRLGRAAARAARGRRGGAAPRRVDRQRRLALRPRAAGRRRGHHRARARASASTSRTTFASSPSR